MILKYEEFLLEKASVELKGPLASGDLQKMYAKHGLSNELVHDAMMYINDANVEALKKKFKRKYAHIWTKEEKNFPIFRGYCVRKESKNWDFWNGLLGDRQETSMLPVYMDHKHKTKLDLYDYTSWTTDLFIADGYADERPGELKVIMMANVKDVKVFLNLFEIGDESSELIIYPTKGLQVQYKITRKEKAYA